MRFRIKWLQIEPERIPVVLKEINYGSEPAARFYALVATSTLIAAFGLIANSVAVIIGAMVVAPLMTPIFGMALALVRGNAKLLGRALQAETLGVILAIGVSAIFGSLPLALEVTPEMLARTQPTLLDMLVAVLAGFAGAYATIDEHLSPALPGVAIAVAVVPPLANAGLCLAVGAYLGMYGSMLLFLANLLSILLVSTVVFIASGLAKQIELENTRELFRRFGVACVGFIIVSVLLTHALIRIVQERYLTNTIEKVMSAELAHIPTS
ncbi:MAG: TIGR00341 family protein, partial [Syntrophales bacterium]|nr:TIGR00341 family protein [Syntrophales bacterium]